MRSQAVHTHIYVNSKRDLFDLRRPPRFTGPAGNSAQPRRNLLFCIRPPPTVVL